MDIDLKRSIRSALWALFLAYFAILAVGIGISAAISYAYHERLAGSFTLAARNSLLIRDLRQAISILKPAVDQGFISISFTTLNGSTVFTLPNQLAASRSNKLLFMINKSLYSESQQIGGQAIGTIVFKFSLLPSLVATCSLWLLFLVFAFPLFARIKARIEIRYREAVRIQEGNAMAALAEQISHDIRSPLSALNVVVSSLDSVPEEKRIVIKNAIQRINDTANELLSKTRSRKVVLNGHSGVSQHKPVDLIKIAPLVEAVVNEKRLQYHSQTSIEIVADLDPDSDAVVSINKNDLSRTLSNIIDNSVEAIEGNGRVLISIREYSSETAVMISDNGKGIPPEILRQIGEAGFSYGKKNTQSGSGLGVYHAIGVIEAANGRFAIQSKVGQGTIVTIALPKV